MALFRFFSRKSPADEMQQAQAAYEKVISLREDGRETRSMRLGMALLCRTHLDKTFVAGAEQTALWLESCAAAAATGTPKPPPPKASLFQKARVSDADVQVYLPEEFANEAFSLGARYQRMEISAARAIELMQGLANQICYYELHIEHPFVALQFLRDELAAATHARDELAGDPPV